MVWLKGERMPKINLVDVSKGFKEKVLYKDANLSIDGGECIGIVGANGSGKSVLFKMISGLESADSGAIYVNGKLVGQEHDFPDGVGLFVNQPGYIEYYDGLTNLKLLAEIQHRIDEEIIRTYMEKVGLDPNDKTKVKNYSAGMKQKLGIAQAIMEDQDIVLLDEPFNALDFQTNNDVMRMLTGLKAEGKTLLMTSHQHEYLEKLCARIYLIIEKKIVVFNEETKKKYFIL
jgi:ABC-2 type transport system ATP-binding protein